MIQRILFGSVRFGVTFNLRSEFLSPKKCWFSAQNSTRKNGEIRLLIRNDRIMQRQKLLYIFSSRFFILKSSFYDENSFFRFKIVIFSTKCVKSEFVRRAGKF
jgi:hypothetical protein